MTPVGHPHKRGRSERAATSAALPCKLGRPLLARRSLIQRWPVDDRDTVPNSAQVSAVKLRARQPTAQADDASPGPQGRPRRWLSVSCFDVDILR